MLASIVLLHNQIAISNFSTISINNCKTTTASTWPEENSHQNWERDFRSSWMLTIGAKGSVCMETASTVWEKATRVKTQCKGEMRLKKMCFWWGFHRGDAKRVRRTKRLEWHGMQPMVWCPAEQPWMATTTIYNVVPPPSKSLDTHQLEVSKHLKMKESYHQTGRCSIQRGNSSSEQLSFYCS